MDAQPPENPAYRPRSEEEVKQWLQRTAQTELPEAKKNRIILANDSDSSLEESESDVQVVIEEDNARSDVNSPKN